MIWREVLIFLAVVAGFAAAVSAYLAAFHGEANLKDVSSTTFAATVGVYVGRWMQRGIGRG